MSITLDVITLPDDLIWIDEFDWAPVDQTKTYSLTGALIVESSVPKQAGQTITLAGSVDSGWAERSLIKALCDKLATDPAMTLTLHDSRTFSVQFEQNGQPIQARPIIDYNNPDDSDAYSLVIKLFTV
jgi:hypothetical protein